MRSTHGMAILVAMIAGVLYASGCHEKQKEKALPDKVPETPALKFEGPLAGWPPHPQDRTNVVNVPWKELPGILTATQIQNLRQAALQNAEVRTALGARYAYVTADPIEPGKEPDAGKVAGGIRMTFYSYANNIAVEVFMKETAVEKVVRREGYQPPEGPEEIRVATELAAREEHLRGKLKGLENTGLVTFPQEGQPGYGHRVLHINFTKNGNDVPSYYALVDLTEQKVLRAGPVVPR
jgi:hypothetical protein